MKKVRKQQDYAEDMNFSQSKNENQEIDKRGMDVPFGTIEELLVAVKNLEKNANTMACAADGIGRYLLNEDGTIRDFTNYELLKGMHEMLKKGIVDMRRSTEAIQKKIEETPTEMTAHFDKENMTRLEKLLKYFKWERAFLWVYIACAAFLMGSFTVKSCSLDKKEADLKQWYDANHEAANFGRFIRMQEPERWDYWHKQWRSDPQMMEDMYNAHMVKGWESKFKK